MAEPRSYTEAIQDPAWLAAMRDKMTSISANHTWDLVPPPPNIELIAVKWIYKLKTDAGSEHYVCQLRKALYGHRQSPQAWKAQLDTFLYTLGPTQLCADPNLYV